MPQKINQTNYYNTYGLDFDVLFITAGEGLRSFKDSVFRIDYSNTINSMVNEWQVVFLLTEYATSGDTVYDLIEPMSYCEIRIKKKNQELTTVMRGFVTSIEKKLDLSSGTPQRYIIVSGENYGRIIKMSWIVYTIGIDNLNILNPGGSETSTNTQFLANQALYFPLFLSMGVKLVDGDVASTMQSIFNNLIYPNFNLLKTFLVDRKMISAKKSSTLTPGEKALTQIGDFYFGPNPSAGESLDVDGVNGTRTYGFNLSITDPAAGSKEQSVYNWLEKDMINRPWNEMFTEDLPTVTNLVFRPTPFRDRHGNFVGPTIYTQQKLEPTEIDWQNIISYDLFRSDANVYNYYFTDVMFDNLSEVFSTMMRSFPGKNPIISVGEYTITKNGFQQSPQLGGLPPSSNGSQNGTVPTGIQNSNNNIQQPNQNNNDIDFSRLELFGYRPLRVASTYLSSIYNGVNQSPNASTNQSTNLYVDGVDLVKRSEKMNEVLFRAYEQNSQYENGTITISGDENIRAGTYISLAESRLGGQSALYYVVSTQHSLIAFGNYTTTLTVTRGEGHLNRTMQKGG